MAFHNPDAFWFLTVFPVLWLTGTLLGFLRRRDRGRFAERGLFESLTKSVSPVRRGFGTVFFQLGVLFLVLALAEPRFGTKTEMVKRSGVDLVIALDTSFSMLAEDVKPSRIVQARHEITRLLDNLKGDRVALVVFSGKAFVQCPLTTDYSAARTLLEFVDAGIVPVPGTNISSAVNESLDLLERGSESVGESQVILLFTDGENLEGDPVDAAKRAAGRGVRIYTAGIGTRNGELIPIRGEGGRLEGYKENKSGEKVKTSLDEETLQKIAAATGGAYFRHRGGEVDMKEIVDEIDSMKKADLNERKISRLRERYQIPLGVSVVFLLAWVAVGERKRNHGGREGGLR